jgi:hypothetical protein
MNNNYYKSPKASWLMKMFWKACGADRYLLERSTYSDQVKYFCLGGIVIATGVLAGIAGGYAIYTIFQPKGNALDSELHTPTMLLSLAFGVVWGLVIFNIDRFIVTSTGKGDGTEKITKDEILSAIPRIIMGMIIALTISKPVEIRMFKSEIDQALYVKQEKLKQDAKKSAELFYDSEIDRYRTEKENLQNEISEKEQRYYVLQEEARKELDGTGGSGQANPGPIYKAKVADADNAKLIWEKIEKLNSEQIALREQKIQDLLVEKNRKIDDASRQAEKLDGLLERIKLAHIVATWEISLFITLLFMVIELTPIFFKMMLIKGPYDYMDENVRELARAESGIEVEFEFYKDKETLQKMLENGGSGNIHEQKHGYEVHKIINHAAEVKRRERINMLKAQDELNEQIIEAWKQRKLEDIKQNPDKYISED